MPWSTSQLADLAGVTVKAVRHYHAIGLLAEPERASNGYKRYAVAHLVRVLQIKRLSELGVPLSQVGVLDEGGDHPAAALRLIDAELAATIARLRRVRAELAGVITGGAPADVPAGFDGVAQGLSDADRSMLLVSARILDDGTMDEFRALLRALPRGEAEDAFDALAADATEAEIARTTALVGARADELGPGPSPGLRARRNPSATGAALAEAIAELYNPAQREVLRRLGETVRRPDPAE